MEVKEDRLQEVLGEQVLGGQGRERNVCESKVACTKALRQAAWRRIFFFLRLQRPAALKQREISRGYIEVPDSCNTFLKSNWESQKVLITDVV